LKSIRVDIQPFVEYYKDDSLLQTKVTYKIGYQYQLSMFGVPVFSSAKVVIEERAEKGPSSSVEFIEKLALKALELANGIISRNEISASIIHLIPEVIKMEL
jgi:hypothetical protein